MAIKEIDEEVKAIKVHEKELARLKKVLSDKLEILKVEKGTSFRQGANFYQIRKRGDLNYICDRPAKDGNFGSWLKGKGKKQMAATPKAAPVQAEAAQMMA